MRRINKKEDIYEVRDFNISELKKVIIKSTLISKESLNFKWHTSYFESYLSGLGAITFIAEYEYTDHDFIDDFSNYYVKCFKKYKRRCARIHFFKCSFNQKEFDLFLNGNKSFKDFDFFLNENKEFKNKKSISDYYLGFIVIKRLPKTIIGRTCLKQPFEHDEKKWFFPTTREYKTNLFGISLSVESLAYQEQDQVVAACATSALWSVLHGTGVKFQHQILSPVDITKVACQNSSFESRYFPNPGLTPSQMAQAIRTVGLEPYLIKAKDLNILKSSVYAYVRGGLPLLLGLSMVDTSDENQPIYMGYHAVAVTGFSLSTDTLIPIGITGLLTKASQLDKIYAHDDQIGPFCCMALNHKELPEKHGAAELIKSISTLWVGNNGKHSVDALPIVILIALYNKIRLPFEAIQSTIIVFDEQIEILRREGKLPFLKQRLVWDIYLTTVNEVKAGMLTSKKWRDKLRLSVLLERMPRFIWRATAFCGNKYSLDLLFDATDLEQSSFLSMAIGYDEKLYKILLTLSKRKRLPKELKSEEMMRIFDWFSKQPPQ